MTPEQMQRALKEHAKIKDQEEALAVLESGAATVQIAIVDKSGMRFVVTFLSTDALQRVVLDALRTDIKMRRLALQHNGVEL